MLHLINKSFTSSDALQSCLQHILPNSVILLYENGVLNVINGSPGSNLLTKIVTTNPVYALLPDLVARGVIDQIMSGINLINYAEFVDLIIHYEQVQPWI